MVTLHEKVAGRVSLGRVAITLHLLSRYHMPVVSSQKPEDGIHLLPSSQTVTGPKVLAKN